MSHGIKILFCIFSPSAPAILIVIRQQKEFQKTRLRYQIVANILLNENQGYASFARDCSEMLRAESESEMWRHLFVGLKKNEVNFEQFLQVLILLLIINVHFTTTATVGGLNELFASSSDSTFLIIISAIWSSKSLLMGHISILVDQKKGFVMMKGKLILALYYIISISSRLIAFLMYFAPSLGLFHLLGHWKMGTYSFQEDLVFDVVAVNGTLKDLFVHDVWVPLLSPQDLTLFTLQSTFICLLISVLIHWIFVGFLVKKSYTSKSRVWCLLHSLNSLVCPPLLNDWDELLKEGETVERGWERTKKELLIMQGLYFVENVCLCIPIFILNNQIVQRNVFHSHNFPLLEAEKNSYKISQLLGLVPFILALSTALQLGLFNAYHMFGHPWHVLLR